MKRLPLPIVRTALLSLVLCTSTVAADETALILGPRRDVTITPKGPGVSEVTITGNSPHFWSQPVSTKPSQTILAFEYFSTSGIKSVSVRFRDKDESMVFVGSAPMPLAETWQPFAIELSSVPTAETRFHIALQSPNDASFQIRNFQVRAPTPAELLKQKNQARQAATRQADAEAILNYLKTDYPAEITEVNVGAEEIVISGSSPTPVQLVEIPPQLPSHRKSPRKPQPIKDATDFTIKVPRIDPVQNRDRISSRWRLESDGQIKSHAKWPTKIASTGTGKTLPKAIAINNKGIGGVPAIGDLKHPIFELGVGHATVNVVLNALLTDKKRPGLTPHVFEGKTYFLNSNFLAQRDKTIRLLNQKGIVVSCILLVGNNQSTMGHPAAEARGIYAMPNLATAEGVHYYRAVLDFLAKRYASTEMRVANWVMHNEIDQAGTWTNMGDQPLPRYLEAYARSARLMYHTSRQYDPHARVFVSLTHHWTKQSSGNGTYVVRDIIDLFTEMAMAEGEFDWGVAYHPYPRNLRDPDTWNDADVTYDFETPYITPRNLEVLPAYLGPDRPILLSEQGFNTPTLSMEDQKRQVAGLIYVFRKLSQLPGIEAYHLHRYQDMPDREGGLRLGILDENGNRKLGWHAYTAIGTEAEAEHAAIADELLPPTEPLRDVTE